MSLLRGFLEVLGALLDSSKYGVLVMTLFVTKIQWAFVYGRVFIITGTARTHENGYHNIQTLPLG